MQAFRMLSHVIMRPRPATERNAAEREHHATKCAKVPTKAQVVYIYIYIYIIIIIILYL